MDVGDRVTIKATIRKLVDGAASLSIPSYNQPHSVPAPKRARQGDTVTLAGEISRYDEGDVTVDLDDGGRITVKEDAISTWSQGERREFTARGRPT